MKAPDFLLRDARHGLRRLVHDWPFTAAAVLILGLGIGANTAIFSLINATLLRGRSLADPDRLVDIYQNAPIPGASTGTRIPPIWTWRRTPTSSRARPSRRFRSAGATWTRARCGRPSSSTPRRATRPCSDSGRRSGVGSARRRTFVAPRSWPSSATTPGSESSARIPRLSAAPPDRGSAGHDRRRRSGRPQRHH